MTKPAAGLVAAAAALQQAQRASYAAWLADLQRLLVEADQYFADLCWQDDRGEYIYGHKAVLYARGNAAFQAKYLSQDGNTRLHAIMSRSTLALPLSSGGSGSVRGSPSPSCQTPLLRTHGSESANTPAGKHFTPVRVRDVEASLLKASLNYLYTASPQINGVISFLFDDAAIRQEDNSTATDRLARDLLFAWRSRLFADVTIQVGDDQASPTHRAILSARCPYFRACLMSGFANATDADGVLKLPSNVFDAASLHLILTYIYTGSVDMANRHVNIAEALKVWRGAQYLSLDTMLAEVRAHVYEACHFFRGCHVGCRRCAATVFAFACGPDIMDTELQSLTRPLLIKYFGDAWTADIGNLDHDVQKTLITDVCSATSATTALAAFADVCKLKSQLADETAAWADCIRSMLVPLEDRIAYLVKTRLEDLLNSDSFANLLDGVAFSNDILTALLALIASSLVEDSAPHCYQALVGKALLREEGLQSHAKLLIEDTRAAIIAFIRHRWMNIRDLGGFKDLENWALNEISDEIDVAIGDLLLDMNAHKTYRKIERPSKSLSSNVIAHHASPVHRPPSIRQASKLGSGSRTTASMTAPSVSLQTGCTAAKPPSLAILTFPDLIAITKKKPLRATEDNGRSRAASDTASSTRSMAARGHKKDTHIPSRPKSTTAIRSAMGGRGPFTPHRGDKTTDLSDVQSSSVQRRMRLKSTTRSISSLHTLNPGSASAQQGEEGKDKSILSTKQRNTSFASVASRSSLHKRRTPLPRTLADPNCEQSLPAPALQTATVGKNTPLGAHRQSANPASIERNCVTVPTGRVEACSTPGPAVSSTELPPPLSHPLQPPGTTLNIGIPCVITHKDTKFRGTIKYLGEVMFTTRALVGVEVRVGADQTLCDLEWNEGTVDGVKYFEVNAESQTDPLNTRGQACGRHSKASALRYQDTDDCVSKGAFVDPSQVLYVL